MKIRRGISALTLGVLATIGVAGCQSGSKANRLQRRNRRARKRAAESPRRSLTGRKKCETGMNKAGEKVVWQQGPRRRWRAPRAE